MSSILKALRKLEDEKAELGEGSVNLAHDILKRNHTEHRTTLRPIFAVCCVLLIIAGGGWVYWSRSHPQPASPTIVRQSAPPERLQPRATPQRQSEQINESLPKAELKITPEPAAPVDKPEPEATTPQNRPVTAAEKSRPSTVIADTPEEINIPDLRVDTIIYHRQPSARLAIINDLPVMEGTDINGARVKEIMPDRVRFSYRGIVFNKFASTPEK